MAGKRETKAKYQHFVPAVRKVENWYKNFNFVLIENMEDLKNVFRGLTPGKYFMSFDTETTGLDFEELELVGYSFSLDGKTAYYVPVYHFEYAHNLGEPAVEFIYCMMVNAAKVFMYNARYDMRVFEFRGYKDVKNVLDTKRWRYVKYDMSKVNYYDVAVAVWAADTNQKMPSLKWASEHFLGFAQMHFDEVIEKAGNFFYLNPSENPDVTFYAASDALCTYLLVPVTIKYFQEGNLATKVDNRVLYPLMHYETEKLWLDKERIEAMLHECQDEVDRLEREVYEMIGYQINLNSPVQVAQAFQRLGIDTGQKTDSGGMATGMKILENLPDHVKEQFPALKSFVNYKETFKLMSSYFSVLKKEGEKRGFLRGAYQTTNVPTGRLSAGKDSKNTYFSPINLQALPKPHVCMFDVFDLGNRDLYSRKDNIILGYKFVPAKYDENKQHIIPDDPQYIGWAEGMDPKLNVRSCIMSKMYEDSAEEEFIYVACDYAAQELRITANISKEPVWADAFIHGRDVHKACYSLDTEVLTPGGWKTYDQISEDTLIGQYNPDTEGVEWVPAGPIYWNESREMYHFEGTNTDLLVTPNHRMYSKTAKNWRIYRADELASKKAYAITCSPKMPQSTEFSYEDAEDAVEIAPSYHKDGFTLDIKDYLELLGFVITDGGTCRRSGGQKSVYFGQSEVKSAVLEKMQKLNERFDHLFDETVEVSGGKSGLIAGRPYTMRGDFHRFSITSARLYDRVLADIGGPLKGDRVLSDWVFNLPDNLMKVFLQAMIDGDGSYSSNGPDRTRSGSLYIQSKKLADQIQLILMRMGYSTHYTVNPQSTEGVYLYRIMWCRDRRTVWLADKNATKIQYDTPVRSFCFSVPSGILVVRRNSKISVCGNTACQLWGEENYNKDLRKRAKGVNFGVIYGMGAPSMIDPKYGIHTLADAEAFFEQYKSALPTLFQWIDRVQRAARRNGTVCTFFGRPRRVKGYYDAHNAGFANRTATNTQIQGTAGDILKIVMCKLWQNMLNNDEYKDDVRFMITIHDEIGYSVRSTRAEEIIKLIEDTQTFTIPQWPIPLICEASVGWTPGGLFAVERVNDPSRPGGYTYRPKLD